MFLRFCDLCLYCVYIAFLFCLYCICTVSPLSHVSVVYILCLYCVCTVPSLCCVSVVCILCFCCVYRVSTPLPRGSLVQQVKQGAPWVMEPSRWRRQPDNRVKATAFTFILETAYCRSNAICRSISLRVEWRRWWFTVTHNKPSGFRLVPSRVSLSIIGRCLAGCVRRNGRSGLIVKSTRPLCVG